MNYKNIFLRKQFYNVIIIENFNFYNVLECKDFLFKICGGPNKVIKKKKIEKKN